VTRLPLPETLPDFFSGAKDADTLVRELEHSVVPLGPDEWGHPIKRMAQEFEVTPQHLVRVCEAVLDGLLRPAWLQPIGFCLMASDSFSWDADSNPGRRVANVASEWSAPEVNFPLTAGQAGKWRAYLPGESRAAEQALQQTVGTIMTSSAPPAGDAQRWPEEP
jgi:hypothetical protein